MKIEIHELDITDGLNKMLYDKLKAENKHLKEVLIRCKEYLPEWITPMDILAEIDKLEVK